MLTLVPPFLRGARGDRGPSRQIIACWELVLQYVNYVNLKILKPQNFYESMP